MSLPTSALSLTLDELSDIIAGAALLPGKWTAAAEHTEGGRCYAGLIALDVDASAFAFLLERRADGLGVARASGEVVAKGCASIVEAMVAIRRAIRHG